MQQKKTFMSLINAGNHLINSFGFAIYMGAVISYIGLGYNKKKKFKETTPIFKRIFHNKSERFYILLDLAILPFIAIYVGNIIINPTTLIASLYTGLTWTATLSAFAKEEEPGS